MKYRLGKAPKKKWLWESIWRIFWGATTATALLVITLFVTMYFNNYSVFWWLYNTTSGVWYVAGIGAILGLSFDFVSQNLKQFKKPLAGTRAFHRLRITRSLSEAFHPVKMLKRG